MGKVSGALRLNFYYLEINLDGNNNHMATLYCFSLFFFFFFTICKVFPETTFEVDKILTGLKELRVLALVCSEVN